MSTKDAVTEAVANAEAHLNNVGLPSYNSLLLALEQIDRLDREGSREGHTIREALGEIARKAIA